METETADLCDKCGELWTDHPDTDCIRKHFTSRADWEKAEEAGVNVRIQYHQPDEYFVAVFVRDGLAWYLDGALVGTDSSPWGAVNDLYEIAATLVLDGDNALLPAPIDLDDRAWLFREVLDARWPDADENQRMYTTMRDAFKAAGREWVL